MSGKTINIQVEYVLCFHGFNEEVTVETNTYFEGLE